MSRKKGTIGPFFEPNFKKCHKPKQTEQIHYDLTYIHSFQLPDVETETNIKTNGREKNERKLILFLACHYCCEEKKKT